MKFSKIITLLSLISLTVRFSIAQAVKKESSQENYKAVHWDVDNGLSQDEVYSMIKDMNGFLWIGANFGLNRFDGSTFKNYFEDKNKKNNTILDNSIHGLIEDSLHNIWIGTRKGLSCYDIKADTFRNSPSLNPGLPVVPFWATKDEIFCWDHSESGLIAYNIHSLKKKNTH